MLRLEPKWLRRFGNVYIRGFIYTTMYVGFVMTSGGETL
jgi:hypothetical protein